MAFFVSRIGVTAVAGHQVAVNMISMMFMLPLAIANATSTLVAQRVGADDAQDARQIGWAGLEIGILIRRRRRRHGLPPARAGGRALQPPTR
jgi:MATE family multidrug resistance protein